MMEFLHDSYEAVDRWLVSAGCGKIAVVTDTVVAPMIPEVFGEDSFVARLPRVVIPSGEDNKNLATLASVWEGFGSIGLTRRDMVVNIGGGVVTDLGGFAAATFKRGVRFVNIPTTLLCAADASVGGKTAVNFGGLKNEVGVFAQPEMTFICSRFFTTLSQDEFYSGYAEIVKMGFITGEKETMSLLASANVIEDPERVMQAVRFAVEGKAKVVDQDPTEKGWRKVLNFGHTAGHAFESLLRGRGVAVTHGCAVAHGMLVALILSHIILGADSHMIHIYARFLRANYGHLPIGCDDYPELVRLMLHDKKNASQTEIRFVLLEAPGSPRIDIPVDPKTVLQALDLYRDL